MIAMPDMVIDLHAIIIELNDDSIHIVRR